MLIKKIQLLWLLSVVFTVASVSMAMPPAPQLLDRIQSGSIPVPYYLSHEHEIRATGVNAPNRAIIHSNTDETDTTRFKAIVLLVDFSDHVAQTPASYFDSLLFGSATGTIKNYYSQVSYGTFFFSTNNYPSTIGWLRMPHPYTYYVNGRNGFGTYPQNAASLAEDAVMAADSLVNFSQYVRNNRVQGLFIIHAGRGAELGGGSNDIWSHAGSTHSNITLDSVIIRPYSMEPEYWQTPGDMTCGVYCHEMGHSVLGIPDLYDTDYSSEGVGRWCLMAGGSWGGNLGNSPANPSAWARMKMGFVTATNVTTPLYHDTIRAIENTPVLYRLALNGSTTAEEYFLVENRQRTGYDASIPTSGLCIWHIDETAHDFGNTHEWYPGHTNDFNYRVALEQADGRWDLERNINSGDAGDPYPGSNGNRTFTTSTNPNSRAYIGSATRVAVMNISDAGAFMTADLQTNGSTIVMITPNGGEQWSVGAMNMIRWGTSGIIGSKTIEINRNYPTGTWSVIANNVFSDSTYEWEVTGDTSTNARIRVRTNSMTPQVFGESDSSFTIGMPVIVIRRPNGGEFYPIGEVHGIFWSSIGVTGTLRIEINRNFPAGTWDTIATVSSTSNNCVWNFPGPPTDHARIRIRALDMAIVVSDTSDSDFSIYDPTGVVMSASVPTQFGLPQVYPNPFNASTTITFDLPNPGRVKLQVFDPLGNLVTTLADENTTAGTHNLQWNATASPSGLYFVRLSTPTRNTTKKMMLIK